MYGNPSSSSSFLLFEIGGGGLREERKTDER